MRGVHGLINLCKVINRPVSSGSNSALAGCEETQIMVDIEVRRVRRPGDKLDILSSISPHPVELPLHIIARVGGRAVLLNGHLLGQHLFTQRFYLFLVADSNV